MLSKYKALQISFKLQSIDSDGNFSAAAAAAVLLDLYKGAFTSGTRAPDPKVQLV